VKPSFLASGSSLATTTFGGKYQNWVELIGSDKHINFEDTTTILLITLLIMTLLTVLTNATLHICFLFTVLSKISCK
jgi:hypothetical protein